MKKVIIVMLVLVLCMSMATVFCACDLDDIVEDIEEEDTKDIHIGKRGEWISFNNGVSFNFELLKIDKEIKQKYRTLTATGKFIMCAVKVKNQSNDTFVSSEYDVWLKYNNKTNIEQSNFVYMGGDGWRNIELPATLEKTYVCIFDVGEDVTTDKLDLVISNGSILHSENIIINF